MIGLREYLNEIDQEVMHISRSVSPVYEVAAITARAQDGNAVLFENVDGSKYMIVSNLLGTRSRFALALGTDAGHIHQTMHRAITGSRKPQTKQPGAFMDNHSNDIGDMPIVTHFEKESGPFITSSLVFTANPQTKTQNTSFHRMMPLSPYRFTMRMVEGRHLHRCYTDARDHGEDLRVAISVGVHPAILVAGAYQAAWGEPEMNISNAILGGNLVMSTLHWSGLEVPAHSEIVIEGRILCDVTGKEWMVEMLQTYDHARDQPVLEVENVYHRDNPIFHDILSGYGEHRLLMGMPAESKIDVSLGDIPHVKSVTLSSGGCNWLHAVVCIKKDAKTDVRHIIQRTFEAHRSLKQVVVVDNDINPDDAASIEYAMATRFQADKDMYVISGVRGSSLDPSSDQANLKTAKLGIDATRPLDKRPEGFEIARIPGLEKTRLDDYL